MITITLSKDKELQLNGNTNIILKDSWERNLSTKFYKLITKIKEITKDLPKLYLLQMLDTTFSKMFLPKAITKSTNWWEKINPLITVQPTSVLPKGIKWTLKLSKAIILFQINIITKIRIQDKEVKDGNLRPDIQIKNQTPLTPIDR